MVFVATLSLYLVRARASRAEEAELEVRAADEGAAHADEVARLKRWLARLKR